MSSQFIDYINILYLEQSISRNSELYILREDFPELRTLDLLGGRQTTKPLNEASATNSY